MDSMSTKLVENTKMSYIIQHDILNPTAILDAILNNKKQKIIGQ